MADYRIKVSTEEVRTKAATVQTKAATMEGLMSDMKTKVMKLNDVCKSDSGTDYIAKYETVTKNIQASLDELNQVATNLLKVADEVERTGTETIGVVNNMSNLMVDL